MILKRLFGALIALSFAASPLFAAEYTGRVVRVDDGASFSLKTSDRVLKVRLCGIRASERGQPGYHDSRRQLISFIGKTNVRCVMVGKGAGTPCDDKARSTTRNGIIAQCFLGDADIAAEMVKSGHACDWPKVSGGRYKINDTSCVRN